MAADPNCQTAYDAAEKAAKAAAKALGVKDSPLVNALLRWKDQIPDGANKQLKDAFIEKMNNVERAAKALAGAAAP